MLFVATYLQREERTRTETAHTFMMPFQLSPVDTLKRVRKAMPKLVKVACRLRPSHGFSSLQSAGERSGSTSAKPSLLALLQSCTHGLQLQHGGWLRGDPTVGSRAATLVLVQADEKMDGNTAWLRGLRLTLGKVFSHGGRNSPGTGHQRGRGAPSLVFRV